MKRIAKFAGRAGIAATIVAAQVVVMASGAAAGDRYPGAGRHPGFDRHSGYGRGYVAPNPHGWRHDGGHRRHRGSDGRAIALGVGALILGTIIANEVHRQDRYRD